jgi:hypothetical protein
MKMAVFWHFAPCSLVVHRCFRGTHWLHYQGDVGFSNIVFEHSNLKKYSLSVIHSEATESLYTVSKYLQNLNIHNSVGRGCEHITKLVP